MADLRGDIENLRERGARGEGAVAGLLNHRAIGDRVGERNAQFDEIGAAAFERCDEAGRRFGRGIACREVGDHAAAVFLFQRVRKACRCASLVEFCQIFAVDIDVFVAASGEVDDEDLARVNGRAADRFRHGVRGFERRNDAFGAASVVAASMASLSQQAQYSARPRSCSQACSGPTEA